MLFRSEEPVEDTDNAKIVASGGSSDSSSAPGEEEPTETKHTRRHVRHTRALKKPSETKSAGPLDSMNKVKNSAKRALGTATALGKRTRSVAEDGTEPSKPERPRKKRLTEAEKLQKEIDDKERDAERKVLRVRGMSIKELRALPPMPRGYVYNIPEDELEEARRRLAEADRLDALKGKAAKPESQPSPKPETHNKRVEQRVSFPEPAEKKYLEQGLYAGQKRGYDPKLKPAQNLKRLAKQEDRVIGQENSVLPPPMFRGNDLINNGRDFKLPFDIYSPLPAKEPKPDQYRKIPKSKSSNASTCTIPVQSY